MPYVRNDDLPLQVRGVLPFSAQSLFRRVFNASVSRGLSDERAMQVSWGAVKQAGYEKGNEGKWVKKGGPGSGNFGHAGRPGEVGGSSDGGGGGSSNTDDLEKHASALAAAKQRMAEGKNAIPLFTADIKKVSDDDQRLVFGWASIVEDEHGNLIVDSQGDTITPDELEKAAYAFVHDVRKAGEMHRDTDSIGTLVESIVLTKQKREIMGLPPGPSGWFVGFRIAKDEVWQKIKDGSYSAFSIGGRGTRKEMSE